MSRDSQRKQPRQYSIAAQVREAIGAGPAADVRAGRAGPARYQCLLCDRDGDARRTLTTVVLLEEGPGDILAYAHARCLPSQVTTLAAVAAARAAAGTPEPPPGPSDVMLAWYGPHAAVVADEPATPALLTPDGAVNLSLSTWLSQGFTVATPSTSPPLLPAGWAVRLAGRSLTGITAPSGWWWKADLTGRAVELPSQWVATARQHGAVAVLAGDIGLDDAARGEELDAVLDGAVSAGRVAYGLAALAEEQT